MGISINCDRLSGLSPKISQQAKLRFSQAAIAAAAALSFVCTFGGTSALRLWSHYTHKPLFDDLEKAQIKSVAESLNIVLSGPNRGQRTDTPQMPSVKELKDDLLLAYRKKRGISPGFSTKAEAAKIAKQAVEIRYKIARGHLGKLREDLKRTMASPLYQMLEDEDSKAVNFLQFIAIKLIAVDGNDALRNYGKQCLGSLDSDAFSAGQLADLLSNHLKKPGFSYDNYPLYIACHPFSFMHSARSVFDPLGYDAGSQNPTFSAYSFCENGKKMTFYYGPGPTGSPIFEHGVLPAYKKFGVFELRFNYQDTIKKAEYQRVKEIERMGEEHPETLFHALFGFDTKMKNNASIEFDSADAFFASYRTYIKNGVRGQETRDGHSGFAIPAHLLSDAEVDTAIGKAQEFCRTLSENNEHWEKAIATSNPGKARMAKMMQLVADAYLALAILYQSLDSITPEMAKRSFDEKLDKDLTTFRTSGACKQNIDRAVVENIALRLFFRWANTPTPLTQQEVYEIAGAVFGRARLADDRKIVSRRYQILDDLLRFIESAPGGVQSANALLKTYRHSLSPTLAQQLASLFHR